MNCTMLIVDDEVSNLQKLQRTFYNDFQIVQAQSGEAALDILRSGPVDVIITDQRMAGMTGVDLLSRSLDLCPQSIRIILTGYTEVDYLMDAINQGQVHRYITKPWEPFALRQIVLQDIEHRDLKRSNQVMHEQLRIAHEVQSKLFPQRLPSLDGLDCSGVCRSAGEVGGDYYDFIQLSDHELCVAVGDVAGKGISAALLMASLQALLRSHVAHHHHRLGTMLEEINEMLRTLTDGVRFATFFCAVYDSSQNRLTFANAGHNPPLLVRPGDRSPIALGPTGIPLGIFGGVDYGEEQIGFSSGDTLLIYTDGVVEAQNPKGDDFGEERLRDLLVSSSTLSALEIQEELLARVTQFTQGRAQEDDVTLVVMRKQ